MKKLIIAVSAASIIITGALTAFAANSNNTQPSRNCPYNYENCPNNGERPLDGTGLKKGCGNGNTQNGRGMGRMMNDGVCPNI